MKVLLVSKETFEKIEGDKPAYTPIIELAIPAKNLFFGEHDALVVVGDDLVVADIDEEFEEMEEIFTVKKFMEMVGAPVSSEEEHDEACGEVSNG